MLAHHSRSVSVVEAYRLWRINELLTDLVLVLRRLRRLGGLRDRRRSSRSSLSVLVEYLVLLNDIERTSSLLKSLSLAS